MPETLSNENLQEPSSLAHADEQALARYREHPTPDNLVTYLLAYASAAAARIARLTRRLEVAEADIRAMRKAGSTKSERPRLRPGSLSVPAAAPQADG